MMVQSVFMVSHNLECFLSKLMICQWANFKQRFLQPLSIVVKDYFLKLAKLIPKFKLSKHGSISILIAKLDNLEPIWIQVTKFQKVFFIRNTSCSKLQDLVMDVGNFGDHFCCLLIEQSRNLKLLPIYLTLFLDS